MFDTVLANYYLYFLISSEKENWSSDKQSNMLWIAQVVEFEQYKNHAANVLLNFKLKRWE